jgi:hypothetical protein
MATAENNNKERADKISFISYIIPKFADEYKMGTQDAYFYLKQYGGWDFLLKHWWALHTDNPFWVVRDMHDICEQNGGLR